MSRILRLDPPKGVEFYVSEDQFFQKREFPSVKNWKSRGRKKGSQDSWNSVLWPILRSPKFIEIENWEIG